MKLVLVEHAVSPQFVDRYLGQDMYNEHLSQMDRFAKSNNIPYWRLALDADLGNDHYSDWAHISSLEAQSRLREALVQRTMEAFYVQ